MLGRPPGRSLRAREARGTDLIADAFVLILLGRAISLRACESQGAGRYGVVGLKGGATGDFDSGEAARSGTLTRAPLRSGSPGPDPLTPPP